MVNRKAIWKFFRAFSEEHRSLALYFGILEKTDDGAAADGGVG